MIKNINKRLVKVTSAILISTFVLSGCGAGDSVAKVNGEKISVEEYSVDYDIIKKRYETQFGPEFFDEKNEEGKTMEEVLKENVLDKLVIEEIIMQKAKKDNILPTDEEVNEQINSFKEMVGGKEGFEKFLETNEMTEEYFKTGIKKELAVEKYREKYLKDLKIDDKEMKEYYEKNKKEYETIEASHILVETEEEAKAILKELKEGGDFAELAKKSKDEGSAANGGSLGYFGRGQMIPEFEQVAFNLKVGEISEPVKTEYQPNTFGYHIIKVTDKKDSLEQVKEEVKIALENEKFEANLEALKKEAKVKTYIENTTKVGAKEKVKDDTKDKEIESKLKYDKKVEEKKTEDKKEETNKEKK